MSEKVLNVKQDGKVGVINGKVVPLLIALFFIYVFGNVCPTWATVTRLGVQMLGILIGWLILASSGFGLVIPSLIAMSSCVLTGYFSAADMFSKGIGNSFNVLVIFIFVIIDVFIYTKTGEFIVRWALSRKFISGKPYLLTGVFLIAMVTLGAILGSFGILAIAIAILVNIADVAGIKRSDDWIRFLLISVVALSGVTEVILPFKPYAQMYINIFNTSLASINYTISEGVYLATGIIIAIISIILLMIVGRFVFNFDLSVIKNLDTTKLQTEEFKKMSKKQRIVLVVVLLSFFFPSLILLLPSESAIFLSLNSLTQALFMGLCIAFMAIFTVDGEPIMSTKESFARGVNWDIVFGIAAVILVGGTLGGDDAGLTAWFLSIFEAIFADIGFIPIIIVTSLISCILTQFFSNTASGLILCSVLAPLSIILNQRGINVSILPAIIGIGTLSACLIPAGSGQAAIMLDCDIFTGESGARWAMKNGIIVLATVTIAIAISGIIAGIIL